MRSITSWGHLEGPVASPFQLKTSRQCQSRSGSPRFSVKGPLRQEILHKVLIWHVNSEIQCC